MPKLTIEQNQTETPDTEIADAAALLAQQCKDCFQLLVKRRCAARDAGYKPLDAEFMRLAEESANIEDAAQNLQELLRAKAAAKLAEQREAEEAPKAMRVRQQELERRSADIEEEKEEISQSTLDAFFKESQTIIRAGESLFWLLNQIEAYLRQERRGFVSDNALADLTTEWQAGNRWYGGR
jgi:Skp family chaperone for outer membrane proteins